MPATLFHTETTGRRFADVILPLAAPKPYTYLVPPELEAQMAVGLRVEVPLQNKLHAGLVQHLHEEAPKDYAVKPIISVLDDAPLVTPEQVAFWQWLADYYFCTLGEVMAAALPPGLRLSSETRILANPEAGSDFSALNDKEYLIAEALQHQPSLSLDEVRGILQQKGVQHIVQGLFDKGFINVAEELEEKYKPTRIACVRLSAALRQEAAQREAFDILARAAKQTEALMALILLEREGLPHIPRQRLLERSQASAASLSALEARGFVECYEVEKSVLPDGDADPLASGAPLSPQQANALAAMQPHLAEGRPVLLHGVTGSGKTRVYTELMQAVIEAGGQVLYLLPEIALTAQIVQRLTQLFGGRCSVYHSRLNQRERVELWQKAMKGQSLIIGARSALLLPFKQLRLIIVDEEHDASFKQQEPSPRYHARDAAIVLAKMLGAHIVLGSATPSIESYFNATVAKKYGLVEMPERFGGIELPETIIADASAELKDKEGELHLTQTLMLEMQAALLRGEQIILFQNRRGFAPALQCGTCGHAVQCVNCDISLTFHKHSRRLRCHYCGHHSAPPEVCPACGSDALSLRGFGTERIEDELLMYFPEARIARMDFDSIRTRHAHTRLIMDFEERKVDILVGTQMVTKGLDFDHVAVVGVLSADQLVYFPDFRAAERAFQLMVQVSGRAGRKHKRGKVVIQAKRTQHPVVQDVLRGDYVAFFQRELQERQSFGYPPFTRLIEVTLKHREAEKVNLAGRLLADWLGQQGLGPYLIGPTVPGIARVRGQYLLTALLKLPRQAPFLQQARRALTQVSARLRQHEGLSQLRVVVNVDA